LAAAWGSQLILLRGVGHLNLASGHGEWPDGLALLGQCMEAAANVRIGLSGW
jgi:hypothetical protein